MNSCRVALPTLPTIKLNHINRLYFLRHFWSFLLQAIGAKSIDLEWVQVHPTGLVKPDDADAKIKFLAAEAWRRIKMQERGV